MLVVGYVTRAMVIKALTKVKTRNIEYNLNPKPKTQNPKPKTPTLKRVTCAGAHAAWAGRQLQVMGGGGCNCGVVV